MPQHLSAYNHSEFMDHLSHCLHTNPNCRTVISVTLHASVNLNL